MHLNPVTLVIMALIAWIAISSLANQSEGLLWLNLLWAQS